ncbi:MAG: acyl-CoA dehydrogenase family protein, partial [Alphaproteobacteria bacterium]
HAQWADWIFCLVRTTPGQKPQEGISFILIDMKTPGISVRPIVTIDGPPENEQEVNQVFFDNVKVPKENLIGKQDEGWTYAKYLLEFERGNAYASGLRRSLKKVRSIASVEGLDGGKLLDDADFRRKLDEVSIQIDALDYTEMRFFSRMSAGQRPGAESSLFKTRGTELQQAISELAVEAIQYSSMPFVQAPWEKKNEPWPQPDHAVTTSPYYFNLRKASIYAGSNEIQRNIMAKMVLGL